jgi:D-serine deaminase-like pyridoxal phosphate-dependent protein
MESTQQAFEPVVAPPAARVGDDISVVDTPSLILELDAFEENLRTMQVLAERHGVALRPHAKAHRCPEIALRQVALGAQGICCQKLTEAAVFANAGLRDIHISNEVVGPAKLALLGQLAAQARVSVCVDNAAALEALSAAMVKHAVTVGVLVDVDVGQKRCGVQNPDQAVALARLALGLPNIQFAGLQAYHGGLQHKRSLEQRQKSCERVYRLVRTYLQAFEGAGIACRTITGGGTGTAAFDVASGVFTEIQAGTYAFMDGDYASIDWGQALSFRHSLFVLGTVMSTPTADRAVLDFGLKSTTAESGLPVLMEPQGWRCTGVSDEHTVLRADEGAKPIKLGARLRVAPGHCDPTFNLHDSVVVVRGQSVEAIWPISARGLSR